MEARADRRSAVRLITVWDLADALVGDPLDPSAVAATLQVTERILRARLRHLTEAEKNGIDNRLACREEAS